MKNISWWKTDIGECEINSIKQSIKKQNICMGKVTRSFEKRIANKIKVPYVVALNSGSSSLFIALKVLGIQKGDEVIVPDKTFIATAHAVQLTGAVVILVDANSHNTNIDVSKIEKSITKNTKAIIPVHLNGRSVDMLKIQKLAKKYNLKIIEDTCQSFLSKNENNEFLGTSGDIGCFSTGLTKLITTGYGGFITCKSYKLYEEVIKFRDHGIFNSNNLGYDSLGFNFKISDISSSMGIEQLKKVDKKIEQCKKIYCLYKKAINGLSFIKLIPVNTNFEIPLYIEVISKEKKNLVKYLKKAGIEIKETTPSLHLSKHLNQDSDNYNNSKYYNNNTFILPSGPDQSLKDIKYIVNVLSEYENQYKCILCGSRKLKKILNYKLNRVVTSDTKICKENFKLLQCKKCNHIQKKLTSKLKETIECVYKNYNPYYLNEGKEEYNEDNNNSETTRSKILVNNLDKLIKRKGNILDIGTGTGVFLQEFSNNHNEWSLYAQDMKLSNDKIKAYHNFKKFFIYGEDTLPRNYFDLISGVHVFEHIFQIDIFLKNIKLSLVDEGVLFLQVPFLNENIYDLFTIDHISHFNKCTIYYILKKYFKNVYFLTNQINREISVVATDSNIKMKKINKVKRYKFDISVIESIFTFLDTFKTKEIAVFGTSPIGLYCANILNFNIKYFVDENPNKVGKTLYNKNIVHPKDINENIDILVPYSIELLQKLKTRYKKINFIHLQNSFKDKLL